jgi:hypothetical protein
MKPLSSRDVGRRLHENCIQAAERQRVFEIDGGYVVVCGLTAGLAAAEHLSSESRRRHITLVLPTPEGCPLDAIAATAADACMRMVIYEPELPGAGTRGERAALLARAVRSSARTECGVILDDSRALRHCIDGIAAGDIIVYCCDDPANALAILDEYGANAITDVGPRRRTMRAAAGSMVPASISTAAIPLRSRFGDGL